MSLLKTAWLLASVGTFVAANPVPRAWSLPFSNNSWIQKQCSDQSIDDAAAPAAARWKAAAADDAWNAVLLGWNQEALPAGDIPLTFSGYVGNFFHAKDGLACQNMADNPCDDTIACTGISPAGYAPSIPKFGHAEAEMIRRALIINSMVTLHDVCYHPRRTVLSALV
jgi:hypothetical protein